MDTAWEWTDSDPALRSGEPAMGAQRTHNDRKVLVVDDNTDAAELLARALDMMGYETAVAHDGPSALERAKSFRPDVVLLDIGLPLMNGYEVAARLRSEHGSLMLVAITGYGQVSDVERAHAAGFDHHMVKPVELRAVRELLERE